MERRGVRRKVGQVQSFPRGVCEALLKIFLGATLGAMHRRAWAHAVMTVAVDTAGCRRPSAPGACEEMIVVVETVVAGLRTKQWLHRAQVKSLGRGAFFLSSGAHGGAEGRTRAQGSVVVRH